ncbi:MAG: GLPGLI family protein [Flavisolibacter sp.]
MKRSILFVTLLSICFLAESQQIFLKRGKVEYERKTNSHRLYFSGEEGSWVDQFKKLVPQFKVNYFDLLFNEDKSLYHPGREVDEQKSGFFESPAAENIVYKDLREQTVISQKQIFESQFLVSDSMQNLQWKILPEIRNIAGYDCHKAVSKICDSVVVVAFYTDEIIPSTGPESFGGLPGLILELAIPRLYTTWTATKIENLVPAEEKKMIAPSKGKKANEKELMGKIKEGIKDWGDKYYHRAVWFSSL